MDKIRIDFFDILGYIVPGTALLMVGWIAADRQVMSPSQIYGSIYQVDKKAIYAALFLSYIAGFVLHALGSLLYRLYSYRRPPLRTHAQVQRDWAWIREYGDKHIPILERWYALRALAQNLAAVSLVFALICVVKWMVYQQAGWWIWLVLSLVLALVLLRRSAIFHQYLHEDMAAVLDLHLDQKNGSRS